MKKANFALIIRPRLSLEFSLRVFFDSANSILSGTRHSKEDRQTDVTAINSILKVAAKQAFEQTACSVLEFSRLKSSWNV